MGQDSCCTQLGAVLLGSPCCKEHTRDELSPALLTVLQHFLPVLCAVGYFAPIGGSADPSKGTHPTDRHLQLMRDAFELRSDLRSMSGVPEDEAVKLMASGKRAELMDRIFASFTAYKDMHDVVIVQGATLGSGRLDAEIAGVLNTPTIIACQVRDCAQDKAHAWYVEQSRWHAACANCSALGVLCCWSNVSRGAEHKPPCPKVSCRMLVYHQLLGYCKDVW